MFTRILVCTFLTTGLSQAAYAEGAVAPPATNNTSAQTTQSIPQELRQKLTADGFTEVHIMPSSFLVSAKNKSGESVLMRIGPDSMTVLTEEPVAQTTGSGATSTTPKAK